MAKEKWMVHSKKADFDGFAKELGVSPIVSRIMRNRELDTVEKQRDFLTIDMMSAYESLGKIIGEEVEEDLVNEIFSKFCMGK